MGLKAKSKILTLEECVRFRKTCQSQGKKVVFTNGCFDILHVGHTTYLEQAQALGDFLILGLNSDTSVKQLKGKSRPINSEQDRAEVLAALASVDAVTIFTENTPIPLLLQLKPDIHVKGGDYVKEDLPEYATIKAYGGEIIILPFVDGKSTTAIIKKTQKEAQA